MSIWKLISLNEHAYEIFYIDLKKRTKYGKFSNADSKIA